MLCNIEELRKNYGKKQALRGVSLSLDVGVYGILGENGAGKTTLLRCICGLLRYKGKIEFGCSKKEIGYLPQAFDAFKNLTVRDNMEFFASYKGKDARNKIPELLEGVGLRDAADIKAGALSGGMKRRLGLAQSLLGDPRILVLDEPTSGLDPEERIRFSNLIEKAGRGRCVLVTTHIVQDVENLCNRLIVMHHGLICYDGIKEKAAEYARGKVFCIPKQEAEQMGLSGDIVQFYTAEQPMVRVVTNKKIEIEPVEPTVEDGYLCLLKELNKG